MEKKILQVFNLKKYYKLNNRAFLKAVDDVTFSVNYGETLGIVGESGCGKTTLIKACMGFSNITSGKVFYKDIDVYSMSKKEKIIFTREVQMIFQDPYTSLNPQMNVFDIIAEGIRIQKLLKSKTEIRDKVIELLKAVGLTEEHLNRKINEFSGGQRQRIGIARALAVNPKLMICDEPISALDVLIQSQIINLLQEMKKKYDLTIIFISHDLSMVRYICDRIIVMYLGQIVEIAEADELCKNPLHPYTKALIDAIPVPDPLVSKKTSRFLIKGEVINPINPPLGCRFFNRCTFSQEGCKSGNITLVEIRKEHFVACNLYQRFQNSNYK